MKEFTGIASLVVAVVAYVPYIKDILRNKTKPHALSWLVWAVLSTIAFAIQLTHQAGPGALLMGFTALATASIFLLALRHGESNILTVDWLSLAFACVALLLWFITKRPLISVILIAIIDAVGGFFPTFRKSIRKPHEETANVYLIYALSLVLSLAALQSFTLINALYPASFVVINIAMFLFLITQRRRIKGFTVAR